MKEILEKIRQMVDCKLDELPIELFGDVVFNKYSNSFSEFQQCLTNVLGPYDITFLQNCLDRSTYPSEELCPTDLDPKHAESCHVLYKNVIDAKGDWVKAKERTKWNVSDADLSTFVRSYRCLNARNNSVESCKASSNLQKRCENSKIVALKMIRLTMEAAERLLAEVHDIKIIHYLRDPRGILSSRRNLRPRAPVEQLFEETDRLCAEMYNDIVLREQLEKRFPGRVYRLSYEDLADHPREVTESLHHLLGVKTGEGVRLWLERTLKSNRTSLDPFTPIRANSSKTAHAWEKELPLHIIDYIDLACRHVYRKAGYKSFRRV
jgi:hypothetical protein